jgi:hypothetical protein
VIADLLRRDGVDELRGGLRDRADGDVGDRESRSGQAGTSTLMRDGGSRLLGRCHSRWQCTTFPLSSKLRHFFVLSFSRSSSLYADSLLRLTLPWP